MYVIEGFYNPYLAAGQTRLNIILKVTASASQSLPEATLKIWSPKVVKVSTLKQAHPDIQDLMPEARRIDDKTLEINLGESTALVRDYQLAFDLPSSNVGDEVLACRASIIYSENGTTMTVPCQPIAVRWTDDQVLSTRMNSEVAQYTKKMNADSMGLDDIDPATRRIKKAN